MIRGLLYFGSSALAGLVLAGLILAVVKAVKPNPAADSLQHQQVMAFRKAWMDDCLQHAPPFQCVYMWSSIKPEEFVQ